MKRLAQIQNKVTLNLIPVINPKGQKTETVASPIFPGPIAEPKPVKNAASLKISGHNAKERLKEEDVDS